MSDLRHRPAPSNGTSSSFSSSPRSKPTPKAVDTTAANTTKPNSPSRPSSLSTSTTIPRTPRSPFGAWTGSPATPIAPSFTRQVPGQVMALLLLAVMLLGLFVLAALRDLRGGWIPGLADLRSTTSTSKAGSEMGPGVKVQPVRGGGTADGGGGGASKGVEVGIGVGIDVGGPVPSFPRVRLAVKDMLEFQDNGERGHEAWLRMLPEGDGLVKVAQPRRHGLPPSQRWVDAQGEVAGDVEVFEVAVVRELECLLVVRQLLGRLEEKGKAIEMNHHEKRDAHRCLDHLRQAILCHADTTLERVGPKTELGGSRRHGPNDNPVVDLDSSAGTMRTCRDWSRIKHWLEEHRADHDLKV